MKAALAVLTAVAALTPGCARGPSEAALAREADLHLRQKFRMECASFEELLSRKMDEAVRGEIPSEDLARAYGGRPTHPGRECAKNKRALFADQPSPRPEDYEASYVEEARNKYAEAAAAYECGDKTSPFSLRGPSLCAREKLRLWEEAGRSLEPPPRYVSKARREAEELEREEPTMRDGRYSSARFRAWHRLARTGFFYRDGGGGPSGDRIADGHPQAAP